MINKIPSTANTPAVLLDTLGEINIKGRSLPENPMKFFKPIEDWVTYYINSPANVTHIIISLEIVNADSLAYFARILDRISLLRLK